MRRTQATPGALAAAALALALAALAAGPARAGDDTSPPTTVAQLDPAAPDGAHGWYLTPVAVALTASDDGGTVARTEYRIGDGPWTGYTGPFTVAAEGRGVVVAYRSVDAAGNREETRTLSLDLDRTAPAITVASPRPGAYPSSARLPLAFAAADALSGLWLLDAYLDGVPVASGSTLDLAELAPGEHLLEVFALDAAGNEATALVPFRVGPTVGSLAELAASYGAGGQIRSPLLLGRLLGRCTAVDERLLESDYLGADKLLASFIADVQRGLARGQVEADAGAVLIREAENLRDQLAGGA